MDHALGDNKKMRTNKPQMLSSLQNPLVKHCVKLRESPHYREEAGSVFVVGRKTVEELSSICPPKRVFFVEQEPLFSSQESYQVTEAILKKMSGLPTPEGIAAEFPLPAPSTLKKVHALLALDRISDPGNLGTLIRTALALGWEGVFFLPGCVDPFHEKVLRASRGTLFRFPWASGSWDELAHLKEQNVLTSYVADMEGSPLPSISFSERFLLLLSNEAQGVSTEGKLFGTPISIPMTDQMESLNVAVAGGILMYALKNRAHE